MKDALCGFGRVSVSAAVQETTSRGSSCLCLDQSSDEVQVNSRTSLSLTLCSSAVLIKDALMLLQMLLMWLHADAFYWSDLCECV